MENMNYFDFLLQIDNYENGLFLLDIAAGWGKTHNMFNYISSKYIKLTYNKQEKAPAKFIVTTPSKKNLRFDDFIESYIKHIDQICKDEDDLTSIKNLAIKDYISNFIEVKTNLQFLEENFGKVFETIKKDNRLCELSSFNKLLNVYDSDKNTFLIYDKYIFSKFEHQFRNDLRNYFSNIFRDNSITKYEEKISFLKKNNFKWLIKLYPQVEIRTKKIIFLTTLKFLNSIDPIIAPPFMCWNDDLFLKDSILFMDEFDSAKYDFLKFIADNNSTPFDIVYLFRRINEGLLNKSIMNSFIDEKGFDSLIEEKQKISEKIEKLQESFKEIYKKYMLDKNVFYDNNKFGEKKFKNFIFQLLFWIPENNIF